MRVQGLGGHAQHSEQQQTTKLTLISASQVGGGAVFTWVKGMWCVWGGYAHPEHAAARPDQGMWCVWGGYAHPEHAAARPD